MDGDVSRRSGLGRRGTRLAMVVLVVALAACQPAEQEARPSPTSQTRSYAVFMGAPSPPGHEIGFAAYFPASVTIHAGDSVELFNRGGFQAEHTVTFGADGPLPVVVGGTLNPRVTNACAAPDVASACSASGSWTTLPAYDGRGFWTSGIVYDYGRVEVSTDRGLAPGDYPFGCLIHPTMRGVLHVVAPGEPVDDPGEVHDEGLRASDGAAAGVVEPPAPGVAPNEVSAGWASGGVLVNRFSPARLQISAGEAVTWIVSSLQDVTFDSSAGVARVSSGPLADGTRYRVRFRHRGVYRYHCTLHLGMTGVVVVG
jgi:plastocyanin